MNLALLDVRQGRANRGQFTLSISWLFTMGFLIYEFAPAYTTFIVAPLWTYLFLVIIIRRLRDINIATSILYKIAAINIATVSCYYSIILLAENKLMHDISAAFCLFFVYPTMCAVLVITLLIILNALIFYEGELIENEFGLPPQGLEFNTMISKERGK